MEISVQIRNVYGIDKIYPVCEKAKAFARIAGQTTLTELTIKYIKELGYAIHVQQLRPTVL